MRDARAREMDRPPFKVLGNGTLLEIAERKPRKASDLIEIKGITDLLVRRIGREVIAAVKEGSREHHGPIPRLAGNGRRRMDRAGRAPARRAQAMAIEAGRGARARPRRAVPELRARSDRLARARIRGRPRRAARAQGLVRARVRRRGHRREPSRRDGVNGKNTTPRRGTSGRGVFDLAQRGPEKAGCRSWGKRLLRARGLRGARIGRPCAPAYSRPIHQISLRCPSKAGCVPIAAG